MSRYALEVKVGKTWIRVAQHTEAETLRILGQRGYNQYKKQRILKLW